MFHTTRVLTLAGLLAAAAATATATAQQREQTATTALKAEVRAFLKHYEKTVGGGDEAAIRRLYVADDRFAWFSDGQMRYATPDAILKALKGLSAGGMVFRTEYSNVRATPLTRDLVTVSMSFKTQATVENGPGFGFAGVITMLLERDGKGPWRIIQGHTSTPGGPPGAPLSGKPDASRIKK